MSTPATNGADAAASLPHSTSESSFLRTTEWQRHVPAVATPWSRVVLQGSALLGDRRYNKGLAFTRAERNVFRLHGLLPDVVLTQEVQVQRVLQNLDRCATDLDRYRELMSLLKRNERLFYRILSTYPERMLPLVYTPTVGLACQKLSHIFDRPHGFYVSLGMRGRISECLGAWPERQVRAVVFTDGERILGLGDLGANGMGIPQGKLALYTALGGVDPRLCLPVMIDVGTNNEELLADPIYTGTRAHRSRGPEYDELIEEFVDAVKQNFGPYTLLQFEDFGNANAFRLLEKFQDRACTFNDDIQGTASVVLAGIYASLKPANKARLSEHRYVFYGAGSAGIGIADLIAYAMHVDEGMSIEEARARIHLVDSHGLIYDGRPSGGINDQKRAYAHALPEPHDGLDLAKLEDVVMCVRPSCLIGVSAIGQSFTEAVVRNMAAVCENPMIFPLSNPTSKAECSAEQAYAWTDGRAIFAAGSPFAPVTHNGKLFRPGQGNNSFIFPGLAQAVVSTGARRVTNHMFYVAARALANQVTEADLAVGSVYPAIAVAREISVHIAVAVAEEIYRLQLATYVPRPHDMLAFIRSNMYNPEYPIFALDPADEARAHTADVTPATPYE